MATYLPLAHAVQAAGDDAPASAEYVPLAHASQAAEATLSWNLPAAHTEHTTASPAEYVPTLQPRHPPEVAPAAAPKKPAGQAVHTAAESAPAALPYLPGAQPKQALTPASAL